MDTTTSIRPLGKRVAVRLLDEQQYGQHYSNVIALTEKSKSPPVTGVVVGLGASVSLPLTVGDKLLFPAFAGHKIEHNDEEVVLFHEDELLGKFAAP